MTTIDGKTVGDQYLPSYLSISSWYSPSRCHIQIQSPSAPLKVRFALFFLLEVYAKFRLVWVWTNKKIHHKVRSTINVLVNSTLNVLVIIGWPRG